MHIFALLPCLIATSSLAATATGFGPSPYAQFSDSPFRNLEFQYFHLETFEDGLLNVPGVTITQGVPTVSGPGARTDSVDGDDGVLDGRGSDGRALSGTGIFRFTFSAEVLGQLPTHVGLVWTDGGAGAHVIFEAFAVGNAGLLTYSGYRPQSLHGQTSNDFFLGVESAGGIRSITIQNTMGGSQEIDHLQFGALVPEPSSGGVLLGATGLLFLRRLRKQRYE